MLLKNSDGDFVIERLGVGENLIGGGIGLFKWNVEDFWFLLFLKFWDINRLIGGWLKLLELFRFNIFFDFWKSKFFLLIILFSFFGIKGCWFFLRIIFDDKFFKIVIVEGENFVFLFFCDVGCIELIKLCLELFGVFVIFFFDNGNDFL